VTNPSKAIRQYLGYGPSFGSYSIYISNGHANSYTKFGYSYHVPSGVKNKKTILAGTYSFTPDEVEVFYLG